MVGVKDTAQQLDLPEPGPEGERNTTQSCNKAVSEATQGAHLLSAAWSSRNMRHTMCLDSLREACGHLGKGGLRRDRCTEIRAAAGEP